MKKNFFAALSIFMFLFLKNIFGYDNNSSSDFITRSVFDFSTIIKLLLCGGLLISFGVYYLKKRFACRNTTNKLKENVTLLRNENIGSKQKSSATSRRIALLKKINRSITSSNRPISNQAKKLKVSTGELALAIQIKTTTAKTIG